MSLVPDNARAEIYRELHKAAYDLYEQRGPLLEDDLHEFAPLAFERIMPALEELARAGEYHSQFEESP